MGHDGTGRQRHRTIFHTIESPNPVVGHAAPGNPTRPWINSSTAAQAMLVVNVTSWVATIIHIGLRLAALEIAVAALSDADR